MLVHTTNKVMNLVIPLTPRLPFRGKLPGFQRNAPALINNPIWESSLNLPLTNFHLHKAPPDFYFTSLQQTSVLLIHTIIPRCLSPLNRMPGHPCRAVVSKAENSEAAIVASPYWTIPHSLGACDIACLGCGALHWRDKSTLDQRDSQVIKFSACCQQGKVTIPLAADNAPPFPAVLEKLFMGKSKSKSVPVA
jgi:hypothetical protein